MKISTNHAGKMTMKALVVLALLGTGAVIGLANAAPANSSVNTTNPDTQKIVVDPTNTTEAAPAAGPRGSYEVNFERDLYVDRDISLQGVSAIDTVYFSKPRAWTLTQDPVLNLKFGHSSELLEDRSSLTIRINDQEIASVALGAFNANNGELKVRIPTHMVQDYNALTLVVNQHYTRDCEDPFDPSLWTRVSNESTINFNYTSEIISGNLKDFPYPFYDKQAYGPVPLTLVQGGTISKESVDAAGLLAFAFGRYADYRGVALRPPVTRVEDARSPALLIGTLSELPNITSLLRGLEVSGDEGIVAVVPNPADNTLPVLVVSGRTPQGVRNAALAISYNDRNQVLSGQVSTVRSITGGNPPPPTRARPLPVPLNESSFTVKQLGYDDQTVRGFYAAPIVVPVITEGDSHVRPSGGSVNVIYSYSAQLHTGLSTLEVLLNNVSLKSIPLDNPEGEERAMLNVDLPAEPISPYAELRVIFHLYPEDFGACVRVADRHLWGTLWADSSFNLPRDHYAYLPDLSLLRFRLWPFTGEGADTSMMIVLPDAPSAGDVAAGMQMMANLGRQNVSPEWGVRMSTSEDSPESVKNRIILLPWNSPHRYYQGIESGGTVTTAGDLARTLSSGGNTLLETQVQEKYRTVEMTADATGGSNLIIRSPKSEGLIDVAIALGRVDDLQKLAGNIAVFGDDNSIRTLDVASKKLHGNMPVVEAARVGVQQNWLWLLVAVPLVLVSAILISRAVRQSGGST